MMVIEAVTEDLVCGHCRTPWTAASDQTNGCCAEDAEDAPAATDAPVPALGTVGPRYLSDAFQPLAHGIWP